MAKTRCLSDGFTMKYMKKINWKLEIGNWKLTRRGFTLVELLIVVSILGILAAIVLPEFSGHIQQAKESAAKDNLRLLREAIERYTADHNGVPPGYANGNTSSNALDTFFIIQLKIYTSLNSEISISKSNVYCYGPYLNEFPTNPLNGKSNVYVLANATTTFPESPPDNYGWIYAPSIKKIRLAYNETDSEGNSPYEY